MNILKEILAYKKQELEVRKLLIPEKELFKSSLFKRKCISLKESLENKNKSGIIAEFKRRIPAGGFINRNADVKTVTNSYASFGASGLSILTDKYFFGGNSADLVIARENEIPILRKDFVIDQYDLLVSKAIGTDVVLLIASCLTKSGVREFAAFSKQLGMEVLLEIHEEKEIDHICDDIDMVGINNRDLKNFKVDMNRSVRLGKLIPPGMTRITEAGIDSVEKINIFKEAGYKGFIMGEKFMREPDPGNAFKQFADAL